MLRHQIHYLQGDIKRYTHIGRDAPAGELFQPISFTHSSVEAAIVHSEKRGNNCNIEADTGQISIGVEILLKKSHKALTSSEEDIK